MVLGEPDVENAPMRQNPNPPHTQIRLDLRLSAP